MTARTTETAVLWLMRILLAGIIRSSAQNVSRKKLLVFFAAYDRRGVETQRRKNMKLWWKVTLVAAAFAALWISLAFVDVAAAQGPPQGSVSGKKAGEYFKNVTTSTL